MDFIHFHLKFVSFRIGIGFSLETNLIVAEGQTDYDAALDAEQKMIDLVETLIEGGQLDLSSSVDNFTAVLDEDSFNYEFVELVCTPPYTANNDVYRCGKMSCNDCMCQTWKKMQLYIQLTSLFNPRKAGILFVILVLPQVVGLGFPFP